MGFILFIMSQQVHHCLDDNNCAIYDQTEIECAKAHQIAAHPKEVHHDYRKQHGKWYYRSHQQPGSQVAKKNDEYKYYNQRTFQQILGNSMNSIVHHPVSYTHLDVYKRQD